MSIWLDRKYTLLVSSRLQQFRQINSNLFNFRCFYCGDSQKNKTKARGYIYAKKENYFYGCHNCGVGRSMKSFLTDLDPYLSKEYSMEYFKENSQSTKSIDVVPKTLTNKVVFKKSVIDLPTISSLSSDHLAKQYVISRKLPEQSWKELYYADNFKEFVEENSEKRFDDSNVAVTKPRLIIPFLSRQGALIAFQGRALDDDKVRYITVKIVDDVKLFGLHRIDISKKILVVEGPLDSLFLPNCIATADSNLASAEHAFSKDNLILISDNEPRNKEIVKNVNKWVERGFNVCLLPDTLEGKDINEYIKNNLTTEELLDIIHKNTFSGLRAKMEFLNWKKI